MHSVTGTISTSNNASSSATISVNPRGNGAGAQQNVKTNSEFSFVVPSPKLWSPDSPNLYDIDVTVGDDNVKSYTGFRTISRGRIDGIERPLINGEFVFFFGTLDQGFWPDGLYVPPNREAMVYDLHTLKKLGYNGLRKHVSSVSRTKSGRS